MLIDMLYQIFRNKIYQKLTCWKTECTSCGTEVFKFMHQRILIQHFASYCFVVSIHGLIYFCQLQNFQTRRGQESVSNRFDHSK